MTSTSLFGVRSAVLGLITTFAIAAPCVAGTTTSLADDGGPGTLRSVIAAANSGDTITFGVNGIINLDCTRGAIAIDKNLSIIGPGQASANLAISGGNACSLFAISSGVTANISGITLQNGSSSTGGAVFNQGTLTISNATIQNNHAGWLGGAVLNGGGSFPGGPPATMTITGTTFSGNVSDQQAGGVYNSGNLTVLNSTFYQNSAAYYGGGLMNDYGGSLAVINSTFTANSGALGGGISSDSTGSSETVKSTLLGNNSGGNCYRYYFTAHSGGFNLSDDSSCSSYFTQQTDLNATPTGLDAAGLKSNGGFTQTVALTSGSSAVDAIPVNSCTDLSGNPVSTDQRAISRPQGTACDIGAFELSPYQASIQQPINADASSVFNATKGVVPVKWTLAQNGVATCNLPQATISLNRTAGSTTGTIDESVYQMSADSGSYYRISSCQYVYNLQSSALGAGTYSVSININGGPVGKITFSLK